MNSAGGVMRAAGRAQVVGAADPDASFERLETNAQPLGPARGLSAASNLAIGEISLDQIDQGCAGFTCVSRRQRMREDARLNLVAAGGVAEHGSLEPVENHQYRAQSVVSHVAGAARPTHEPQMQQAADTPALVMQAKRQGTVQIGDHEHGFRRDVISVRRDHDFREICCQCGPLNRLR